jgi:hypothetical protein
MGWARNILGDFFTNSSGRPVPDSEAISWARISASAAVSQSNAILRYDPNSFLILQFFVDSNSGNWQYTFCPLLRCRFFVISRLLKILPGANPMTFEFTTTTPAL